MSNTNLERLRAWLREHKFDAALISNPSTLTWLTGYAAPIETGPDPFVGGPALAWVSDDGVTAVASDAESPALQALGIEVQAYDGYTVQEPLDCAKRMAQALQVLLAKDKALRGGMHKTVAVEQHTLSATLLFTLQSVLPYASRVSIDEDLSALRIIKTPDEIVKIRAALALCDHAQAYMREIIQPGMSELQLWGLMRAQLEARVGTRLPMLADLVSGPGTAEIGGLPTNRVLQSGDAVIFDFVPRLEGYWGDCCATLFVDEPSPELKRLRQVSHDALRRGIDAARPGVRASDLDKLLRKCVQDAGYASYPHHTGHGVGVTYHEGPRIVPYEAQVLEAGMVIALEPGVYVPGVGGARMEDVVLITPDGCEVLTRHLEGLVG